MQDLKIGTFQKCFMEVLIRDLTIVRHQSPFGFSSPSSPVGICFVSLE